MLFVKQPINISIRNFDECASTKRTKHRKHSDLLPDSIRCIVAGPSSCGKTNLLIGLIESENGLKFENIYIFSKTIEQDKYKYLKKILAPIRSIGFYTFSTTEKVLAPNEAKKNSLVIFDDVICNKNQENIKNYYCLGRHRGLDCFYLTQTYTKVSKHLIRDNCNFLILFRQDNMNLKHVFSDMSIGCDMKFNDFRQFCLDCWKEKYGFVVISTECDVSNGRYRKGFSNFLKLHNEAEDVKLV